MEIFLDFHSQAQFASKLELPFEGQDTYKVLQVQDYWQGCLQLVGCVYTSIYVACCNYDSRVLQFASAKDSSLKLSQDQFLPGKLLLLQNDEE